MDKDVTIGFLSCKRIEFFKKNFNAFWSLCEDQHRIDSFIVIDDNSSLEDNHRILELSSKVNIPSIVMHKNITKGHAQSLNLMMVLCKTKYLLIIEDDWLFVKGGKFLSWAIDIMSKHTNVKKVCYDFGSSGKRLNEIPEKDIYKENNIEYFISENYKQNDWPSFTFRQGLLDREACIDNIGLFSPNPVFTHDPMHHPPTCETDYGVRFNNYGYRTAYMTSTLVQELIGPSCFDLNQINRYNESA